VGAGPSGADGEHAAGPRRAGGPGAPPQAGGTREASGEAVSRWLDDGGAVREPGEASGGAARGPASEHFDVRGRARMVPVDAKAETERIAVARGRVRMAAAALDRVRQGAEKGDVLGVARVAGIMAAKRTAELIPLCHPLPLTSVWVGFRLLEDGVEAEARVRTVARTGVEMEALTAVAAACLTVYDMLKSYDRGMAIEDVRLVRKSGGRSGDYRRPGEEGGAPFDV
jgi:cyclic pyranopterin phosphate synthase